MRSRLAPGLAAAALCLCLCACPAEPYSTQPQNSASTPDTNPATPTVAASVPGRTPAQIRVEGNHLKDEPSPYLQQHAHNPVDWHPFGAEALALAREQNKPIFLSIGYSTCHWCHVMEEESFEDDVVAAFLNEHFVSIKVDREQRPDIDAIYIDAVSAMGGSTGWPLTVFLTPELEPFFGGTYYPRHSKGGRPGFVDVLQQVRTMFDDDGEAVAQKGRSVLAQVERAALAAVGAPTPLRPELVAAAIDRLAPARDQQRGGFGRRQKFPQSPLLLAHVRHVARTGDASARQHVVHTLEAMHHGGIYDPLAGSFHRYAVDVNWHLPHFEKTLYDNAQLAAIYIEAGRLLDRPDFVAVGRGVLDDLIDAWQRDDGGFIVGFDADDPVGEGHFYSWTPDELREVLPADDATILRHAYSVTARGDREIEGRSVLDRRDDEQTAAMAKVTVAQVRAAIERSLPLLEQARRKRPAPGADAKELVAWNGLAIMALADAARLLDEPRYRTAAMKAGAWILDTAWKDGRLQRGVCDGESLGDGFLGDYAMAGLGLVRLHAATGDLRWLVGARQMADQIAAHFHDAENHVFLHVREQARPGEPSAPLRLADFDDNALPSGGATAVQLMLELGAITGDEDLYDLGYSVLERAAANTTRRAYSTGILLAAIDHATAPVREVVIVGNPSEATTALWDEASSRGGHVLPVRLPAAGMPADLRERFPALDGKKMRDGKPTAYVCERGRCEAPTTELETLRAQLDAAATGT